MHTGEAANEYCLKYPRHDGAKIICDMIIKQQYFSFWQGLCGVQS